MKENTKHIFKVTFCTLVALVLFAGVILMCIYFAFDNSNDGVADAYTNEQIGVSNLDFSVDEGFYVRNMYEVSSEDIEQLLNYYYYFIPDFMTTDADIYFNYEVGSVLMDFTYSNGNSSSAVGTIFLELSKAK